MGNSFFLILNYTDFENAVNVGQRIQERVQHYAFQTERGSKNRTVSIGVSCFPTSSNEVAGLILKATDLKNGGALH